MSEDKDILSGGSGQDNLTGGSGDDNFILSSKGIFYELTPISKIAEEIKGHSLVMSARVTEAIKDNVSLSGEYYKQGIQNPEVKNSELETESEYSVELDEILTQLHKADDRIAETRQNTMRLGVETRSMLSDLRKQLG